LTLYVVGAAFVLVAVAIGITLFLRARRNRYVVLCLDVRIIVIRRVEQTKRGKF
jgi:hypothetical protein